MRDKKSKGVSQLLVLISCIIFALVAGYFIGYLWSILLAAAFFSWQNRKRMSSKEGGYCLAVMQKRLIRLGPALIMLFLGAAVGTYGFYELQADKSGWGFTEYFELAGCLVFAVGLIGGGIIWGYTGVRDAFFPARSSLAKSIRSQLPQGASLSDVNQLFSIVDKDIAENGLWFDKVAVGKEWVLSDEASYIPGIRLIFSRDEVKHHRVNGSVHSTRILELITIDEHKNAHTHSLSRPKELPPLLECVRQNAPDAMVRPYKEYGAWMCKSDMEWQMMLLEYNRRKGERELISSPDNTVSAYFPHHP